MVQCKQWIAYKVGVDVVRELYGVMAARGATGGYVVTSGRYTDDAIKFAAGRNVQLIDGPKLFALIKQARQVKQPAVSVPQQIGSKLQTKSVSAVTDPFCPICNSSMLSYLQLIHGQTGRPNGQ